MTTPLPSDRPLWEVLVVPGAWAHGPGVVVRFHHAVTDGVGAVDLVERLLGSARVVQRAPAPARPKVPSRRTVHSMFIGMARVAAMFRTAVPSTVLLGPISGQRAVGFVDVELDGLSRGAKAAGGTVNDALLAAVAMAVERFLASEGRPVPASIPVSVPVALPDRRGSGNAVGIMRVELPTGEPGAAARLGRIAAVTRTAKSEARAQGTFELTRSRWGARLFAVLARRQRFVALFVTNVRGPGEQMVLGGAPLERAWALTPIQGNVRLGVSALSYRGRLTCAIHADASSLRADVLAAALRDQLEEIVSAA
jgi:diacylglycerol O-acyltransferase / wax synthase